jgi:alkanesulfonate monooxygenase SsuD/methylene tetrahydromethanopterin reductase-like flavin-dependent oxidoreductase (luciferase family)
MIGVAVVCAESDDRARWLAAPGALSFLRLRTGRPGPFPTPEEAAAYPYTTRERAIATDRVTNQVIGGPDTVRLKLDELLAATGADELMITTMVHDHGDRVRSYERVAELAGLGARTAPTPA